MNIILSVVGGKYYFFLFKYILHCPFFIVLLSIKTHQVEPHRASKICFSSSKKDSLILMLITTRCSFGGRCRTFLATTSTARAGCCSWCWDGPGSPGTGGCSRSQTQSVELGNVYFYLCPLFFHLRFFPSPFPPSNIKPFPFNLKGVILQYKLK